MTHFGSPASDPQFPSFLCSIEKNFICAEVQSYEDLKEYGTEAAVKAAGKLRQQGRTCTFSLSDRPSWQDH
jgi:ribosome-binding ATPase YchF (GTP1/OBG family)